MSKLSDIDYSASTVASSVLLCKISLTSMGADHMWDNEDTGVRRQSLFQSHCQTMSQNATELDSPLKDVIELPFSRLYPLFFLYRLMGKSIGHATTSSWTRNCK